MIMKKRTTEEFIALSKKIYGENKYDYSKVDYINKDIKVCIICNNCKQMFWQIPNHHLQGHEGCKKCISQKRKHSQRKTQEEFLEKAKIVHGNKYDYSKVVYINSHTPIKIFCNECKTWFYQLPQHHLQGSGCQRCNINRKRKSQEEFIKEAISIHGNKYDYSNINYTNNRNKLQIFCNKCKKYFWQIPFQHTNNKQGCPYCTRIKSKGEEYIAKWLSNKNIPFIREKRFEDCRDKNPLPFDFYLPDYNLCIEFQGQQHYRNSFYVTMNKSKEKGLKLYNKMQLHDKIKKEYCLQNNISFLEIRYNENIEDILKANFIAIKSSSNNKL